MKSIMGLERPDSGSVRIGDAEVAGWPPHRIARLGPAPVILEQISKALEQLRRTTSTTVLLSEQNVTFALPHADRVYVLEHGRIVWEGDPARFAAEAGAGCL
jgi:ABC-type branched-subunit amino acid transport system ATPase component